MVKIPNTSDAPDIKLAIAPAANIVPKIPAPIAIAFQFSVVQSNIPSILFKNSGFFKFLRKLVPRIPAPRIPAKFNNLSKIKYKEKQEFNQVKTDLSEVKQELKELKELLKSIVQN